MHTLNTLLQLILHLDQSLVFFVSLFGLWTYLILFLIIFCETGIIITAFLPGDSLLFAAGAFCAYSPDLLNIHLLCLLLLTASVSGNGLNYFLGKWIGPRVFRDNTSLLFNPAYLKRAHAFCEQHGNKAIVLARFIPIIRTFAPFVAGIGYMTYRQFFIFNLIGALIWIGGLLYGSYFFGNIPVIKNHFGTVIIAIIILSVLPAVLGALRGLSNQRQPKQL